MPTEKTQIAIISDETTPYRVHVLRRITREIPEVKLHSLFTHVKPSMPWSVELDADFTPVFFPELSLNETPPISRRSLPLYRRIRDYLVQHHVQLIVLLGYNNLTRAMLIRWAKKNRVPLLLTGDSNIFGESRVRPIVRFVKTRYVRWVIKSVAGLMPMGVCGRAYFRSYANHNKPTFLFPYEPDYERLTRHDPAAQAAFRTKHELLPERHRLLYCGRLVDQKRVDLLIDAFTLVADYRPEWDLVIAGDGELKAELKARVPHRLRNRVKWLGFLQFDEIATCYHCCDIMVLPSTYEPWALVVNEAVAAGLAVIATEVVGAAVELVRHKTNGLIVAPGSVDSLRVALLESTELERCQQMRQAGASILHQWRVAGDPVDGLRQALKHFQLFPLL